MENQNTRDDMSGAYKTQEEARKAADRMGLKGTHTHKGEDGSTLYMPGRSHEDYMRYMESKKDGHGKKKDMHMKKKKTKFQAARDAMYKKMMDRSYKKSSEDVAETETPEVKPSPYASGFDAADTTIGRVFDDVL
jgi:hypothetical protein|tara:strand:+ start:600 stop:1004 length:405 start_codon:yes stop_codon:yes gene_type:complete